MLIIPLQVLACALSRAPICTVCSHDLLPTFFLPIPRKPIPSHNNTTLNNWYIPLRKESDVESFKHTVSGLTRTLSWFFRDFDRFNLHHLLNKLMHSLGTVNQKTSFNLCPARNAHTCLPLLCLQILWVFLKFKMWFIYSTKYPAEVSVCFSSGLIHGSPAYWEILLSTE